MLTKKNSIIFTEPALVIRLEEGELDHVTITELRDLLGPAGNEQCVVIDLTNVASMDSVSLGVLVWLYRERVIERKLSPFVLVVNNEALRQLLKVAGLAGLWPIHDNLVSAVKAAIGQD